MNHSKFPDITKHPKYKPYGREDDFGFYFMKAGDFFDPNGYYFDAKGYGEHGGYYDEYWNYVTPEDAELEELAEELDNGEYLEPIDPNIEEQYLIFQKKEMGQYLDIIKNAADSTNFSVKINNVSYQASENALQQFLFEHNIKSAQVQIQRSENGSSKGKAVVNIANRNDALNILDLQDSVFMNRPLQIQFPQLQEEEFEDVQLSYNKNPQPTHNVMEASTQNVPSAHTITNPSTQKVDIQKEESKKEQAPVKEPNATPTKPKNGGAWDNIDNQVILDEPKKKKSKKGKKKINSKKPKK